MPGAVSKLSESSSAEVTTPNLYHAAPDLLSLARRIVAVNDIARDGQSDRDPLDANYLVREFQALHELALRGIAKAEGRQ